jgi:hypothetical protein
MIQHQNLTVDKEANIQKASILTDNSHWLLPATTLLHLWAVSSLGHIDMIQKPNSETALYK